MQWVTSVSHAQIVENQNIATATLLPWSSFKTVKVKKPHLLNIFLNHRMKLCLI